MASVAEDAVRKDNSQSNGGDGILCELEVTVCTGFEMTAKEEIEETVSSASSVTAARGRVNMLVPIDYAKNILHLRSIDNIMVVVGRFPNFPLSNSLDDALQQIQSLVPLIDWKTGLRVWSLFLDFPHTVALPKAVEDCKCVEFPEKSELAARELTDTDPASPIVDCKMYSQKLFNDNVEVRHTQNSLQSIEAVSCGENCTTDKDVTSYSTKCTDNMDSNVMLTCDDVCDKTEEAIVGTVKKSALSFRATCYRTGKHHCFQSPAAAAHFGGAVQDYFGWNVDLNNYDIELVLCIESRDIRVGISLTNRSLHRRHITHFGKTTLRPTIAYGMLRMCKIMCGETVCDPMCGGGSIPIEAALGWTAAHHLCGDIDKRAIRRTVCNFTSVSSKQDEYQQTGSMAEVFYWDATALPLKDNSVDVFVTDMPFGKRSGTRMNNQQLYPRVLHELARTSRLDTGRACLLTHDHRCMLHALKAVSQWWRRSATVSVNIGGLAACVYLIHRTAVVYRGTSN